MDSLGLNISDWWLCVKGHQICPPWAFFLLKKASQRGKASKSGVERKNRQIHLQVVPKMREPPGKSATKLLFLQESVSCYQKINFFLLLKVSSKNRIWSDWTKKFEIIFTHSVCLWLLYTECLCKNTFF